MAVIAVNIDTICFMNAEYGCKTKINSWEYKMNTLSKKMIHWNKSQNSIVYSGVLTQIDQ